MALSTDEQGVIMACARCAKKNRIPYARLGQTGTCGSCGSPLPSVAQPIDVASGGAFNALVSGSSLPVLVDFWAPWCGPCRAVAPEIEKAAAAAAGAYVVAKVNTEQMQTVAARFGIQSIPTMAVFADGREVARSSGARPAADIDAFVRGSGAL